MTRIICVASVVYFKIRFFFEIYYHENSNFPFAAGLVKKIIGQASLVKCTLETGRTHQIRVHMGHIGHYVVGDQVYGKNSSKSAKYAKNSDFIRRPAAKGKLLFS